MRLVAYGAKWQERAGILEGARIVDLESAMGAAGAGVPASDVRLLLEQADWRRLLDQAFAARAKARSVEAKSVRLGAPVPVPRQMLIAGANTKSHIAEAAPLLKDPTPPREPMILAKSVSSLCGPFDDVIHPPETRKLDYEVELGVVIGRRCRRLRESQVKDHIAGYMTVNEMSARDIQLAEHEANRMTLFPGDIIVTGSPAGVAFFMKPPKFLRPGDKVRCEIESVGAIENLIRAESS